MAGDWTGRGGCWWRSLTWWELAHCSQDGDYVICGSENGSVYIWNKARWVIITGSLATVRLVLTSRLTSPQLPQIHEHHEEQQAGPQLLVRVLHR